ncbi:MAG: sigma-70 family RNA polymerase sigma factor [Comamonadaceae bacterium]|nr:MAG: sigma-70 family RNA polymerase sigma factor [Comamonadaceae bacterium]
MAPIESPRALLFHTARNLCIDASRRRQTEKAWLDYCTAEMIDAAAPSAEHVAEQRQLVMRISQLLAQLPERRRDVFILFKVYAYTREEIALRLGISESAVAKHVVRATLDCATALADLSSHTYRQAADAGKLAGLDVRAQPPAAIHAG